MRAHLQRSTSDVRRKSKVLRDLLLQSVLGISLFVSQGFCELQVTHAHTYLEAQGKTLAEVVLSDVIELSHIEVVRIGQESALRFPQYYSNKTHKSYQNIRILSSQLYREMLNAIQNSKSDLHPPPSTIQNSISFKVVNIQSLRSAVRVANAEVVFDGELHLTLGVMRSKRNAGLWISYPGDKKGNRFQKYVEILNPTLKRDVEEQILERYQRDKKN